MAKIVSYNLAYVIGRVDLCDKHADDTADAEDLFGVVGPVQHGRRNGLCDVCVTIANLSHAAEKEIELCLSVETAAPAPDARRVVREERMRLQTALEHSPRASNWVALREQTREATRVRAMYD